MAKKLDTYTFFGTFLGVGFLPKAPGTWGSLAAFAIYLALPASFFAPAARLWYLLALALFSLISVWICGKSEHSLGADAPAIVLDEVAGYFLAVAFLPHSWMAGLLGFAFFRVFDITKPYPISRSQKLPGGWGVVVDDLLAGLFATLALILINAIYPGLLALGRAIN